MVLYLCVYFLTVTIVTEIQKQSKAVPQHTYGGAGGEDV
jgi:hypothetical protein